MIDRDILLIIIGGVIGLVSSLATLFASYLVEGMRLRRQWERDDWVLLKQKREELAGILAQARPEQGRPPEVEE